MLPGTSPFTASPGHGRCWFAKSQLIFVIARMVYASQWAIAGIWMGLGDVNPPVHAWSCLQVYKHEKHNRQKAMWTFLKRYFKNYWSILPGGSTGRIIREIMSSKAASLGLDNIGLFDRSNQIPGGGHLEQADGTAWMAMCIILNMLEMALEIAQFDMTFEDVATKFFEHFIYIAESLNRIGRDWTGRGMRTKAFSMMSFRFGWILSTFKSKVISRSVYTLPYIAYPENTWPGSKIFSSRLNWFKKYRTDNGQYLVLEEDKTTGDILLSLVPKERLKVIGLQCWINEFLSFRYQSYL